MKNKATLQIIPITFNPKEKAFLKAEAQRMGLSLNGFIRSALHTHPALKTDMQRLSMQEGVKELTAILQSPTKVSKVAPKSRILRKKPA